MDRPLRLPARLETPETRSRLLPEICFLSGSGQLALGEREYAIRPGALFLIKPNRKHRLIPASLVKTLDLKFLVKDRKLLALLQQAGDKVDDKDLLIANRFEHIRREGEQRGDLYREICDLYLTQILIQFLRLQAKAGSGIAEEPDQELVADPITQTAINFIKEHYAEDLDLPTIAHAAGRSDR